jgi:succinate dehydrogenase / fumarate reductase cytochrome b subunit
MMQNNKLQNSQKIKQANGQKNRPKNLNLLTIKLPINALVSILHRATGCVLFLMLPVILLLLQWSLSSALHFETVIAILHSPFIKLMLLGLAWAFFHHFFAGIRHLAMDVHWMTTLMKARYTSKVVLVLGVVATLILSAMTASYDRNLVLQADLADIMTVVDALTNGYLETLPFDQDGTDRADLNRLVVNRDVGVLEFSGRRVDDQSRVYAAP